MQTLRARSRLKPNAAAFDQFHSGGATGRVTSRGRTNADAIYAMHAWTARFADGSDNVFRLVDRRKRRSLCRGCEHQCKRRRNYSGHIFLPDYALSFVARAFFTTRALTSSWTEGQLFDASENNFTGHPIMSR